MNSLEDRLTALHDVIPPAEGFVDEVRRALPSHPTEQNSFRLHRGKYAAFATAIAACVVIAVALWPSPSHRLYAGALAALKDVRVVHITGWTSKPEQTYSTSLDAPATQPAARHEVDEWQWIAADGAPRRVSRQGPITIWDDGQRRYEYQAAHERIYVSESQGAQVMKKFASLQDRLDELNRSDVKKTDLGDRPLKQGVMRGIRIEKAGERRQELWFDSRTRLPVRLAAWTWSNGAWTLAREQTVEYDSLVPDAVATSAPPEKVQRTYASGIDTRFDDWRARLDQLAKHYANHPLPQVAELIARESDKPMESYSFGKLPGITSHVVQSLGPFMAGQKWTLGDYLRPAWEPVGTLRVPKELREMRLNHDLVLASNLPRRQQIDSVLGALGLELTQVTEHRVVWVARHDGRALKDWNDVPPPVANPKNLPLHPGMAASFGPANVTENFHGLMFYQDEDLTADQVLIVDETGLGAGPSPKPISNGIPYFSGPTAIPLAKKWFEEQFGIRFVEEKRDETIYVVRHRDGLAKPGGHE